METSIGKYLSISTKLNGELGRDQLRGEAGGGWRSRAAFVYLGDSCLQNWGNRVRGRLVVGLFFGGAEETPGACAEDLSTPATARHGATLGRVVLMPSLYWFGLLFLFPLLCGHLLDRCYSPGSTRPSSAPAGTPIFCPTRTQKRNSPYLPYPQLPIT